MGWPGAVSYTHLLDICSPAVGNCFSRSTVPAILECQRKGLSCEVHIQHSGAVGRDRHSIAGLVIPQLAVRLDIGHILLGRLAEAAGQGAAGVVMRMLCFTAAVAGSNMGMGARNSRLIYTILVVVRDIRSSITGLAYLIPL